MDITCPELEAMDGTSDYGSRETSGNDESKVQGFCTLFVTMGPGGFYKHVIFCGNTISVNDDNGFGTENRHIYYFLTT